jgi:hypothetical protein
MEYQHSRKPLPLAAIWAAAIKTTMKNISFLIGLTYSILEIGCNKRESIRFYEYLYPKSDSMTFNCVYYTYGVGRDTVKLNFKKLDIQNTVFYCISGIDDKDCRYGELASFLGSAMIFKDDSILLAPLQWDKPASTLKLDDFKYYIQPNLKLTDSVLIPLHDRNIKLSNFAYETLTISNTILDNCLKIRVTEKYKNLNEPLSGCVWLSKTYGIVQWIRVTGRKELRDLTMK